ncbi:MAG: sulfatase, partial [Planctomycetales bacterium 12-60-4]
MNDRDTAALDVTRRYFLGQCSGVGLGAAALSQLLPSVSRAEEASLPGLPELPHFEPRAKRVIFLTQSGGPSQLELYDDKPGLIEWAGKELPESVRQGQRVTTMTA